MIIKKTVELSKISDSKLNLKCDISFSVSSGPIEEARKHLTEQDIVIIFNRAQREAIQKLTQADNGNR